MTLTIVKNLIITRTFRKFNDFWMYKTSYVTLLNNV
jgi:hypothetical protein